MRMLILFLLLKQTVFAADAPKKKSLEFRHVEQEKTADSQEFKYSDSSMKNEQKDEKIYLAKESLLPEKPIFGAQAIQNLERDGFHVSIKLTDEAAKRMADVSRKYLMRRIALLIDGQVIAAPKLYSEISGGQLVISGNFTEEEAEQLAKGINKSGRKE